RTRRLHHHLDPTPGWKWRPPSTLALSPTTQFAGGSCSVRDALRRMPAPRVAAVSSIQLRTCSWGALRPLRLELAVAPPRPGAARCRAPLFRPHACMHPRQTSLYHTSS
uniref:Uncharacterized protein n=1 Tax=Triticum urartu TaxID=4572 RepID=A0A8R7PD50_TRIUA